jgi:predicted enzyme related to lactoylglutathione lyase
MPIRLRLLCALAGLAFSHASAEPAAERPPGKLVWAELLTSGAPAAAAGFYENVLGWRAETAGTGYEARVTLFQDDRPVAAIAHREGTRMAAHRARWLLFFATPDVTATSALAAGSGGSVLMPAGAAPDGSERAVLADPEGAVFGLASASTGETPDYAAAPGEWIWPLLLTRRPDLTADFYATLLDLEVTPERRTPLFSGDFVLASGPRARAALMALPRDTSGRPGWLGLVRVADLDATLDAVEKHDGTIMKAASEDLIGGRVAVVADPLGGVFGLVELSTAVGPRANRSPAPSP